MTAAQPGARPFVSWFAPPRPTVGVEIAPRRVTAVWLSVQPAGAHVNAHATEPLPAGAVNPALTETNLLEPRVVADALRRVFERTGGRPKRIALAVPDSVAKVSLVRFEKVPARGADLDQLVRWQIRKTAPFSIEEAQVSYSPASILPGGGREFVVALARRDLLREYEAACASAGLHAGVVDLASFNLINAVLGGIRGAASDAPRAGEATPWRPDWLLVHVTPEYATLVIMRGQDLIFFRNRPAAGNGNLAEVVHQTAMYYEDRLGGTGFSRVVLAGAAALASDGGVEDPEALRRNLEERLGSRVQTIDPRPAADIRNQPSPSSDLLDALAAPVGIVLRGFSG